MTKDSLLKGNYYSYSTNAYTYILKYSGNIDRCPSIYARKDTEIFEGFLGDGSFDDDGDRFFRVDEEHRLAEHLDKCIRAGHFVEKEKIHETYEIY